MIRATRVLGVLLVVLCSAAGNAVADDAYSEVSNQKLLLRTKIRTSLAPKHLRTFYRAIGMKNFTIKDWQLEDPELVSWCSDTAKDIEMRQGETDAQGEARGTLEALSQACGMIYSHELSISHSCKTVVRTVKKKKKKYRECSMSAGLKVMKHGPEFTDGVITSFSRNMQFGDHGSVKVKASGEASEKIGKGGPSAADDSALSSLARGTVGRLINRRLKDIRDFQLSAPVVHSDGAVSRMCLGRQVVAQDLPFFIVVNTPRGEERRGFVKARKIFDGCTETTVTRKKAEKGRKVRLEPLQAQIILGGKGVKRGMTAREMPQIGLNIGLGAAMTPFIGSFDNHGGSFMLMQEQSLANALNSSELHQYARFKFGVVGDGDQVVDFLDAAFFPGFGSIVDKESVFVGQVDLGLLKRFYSHAFFWELGGGLAASYYHVPIDSFTGDEEILLYGFGVHAQLGVGLQLAPRWLIRVQGGVRSALLMASFVNSAGEEYTADGELDTETGALANLGLLYTF